MSHYVYVPIGSAEHLLVFAMDPDSGALAARHEVPLGKSPHAMCADVKRQYVYVGLREGETYAIAAYAIDQQTGGLSALGEVAVEGMPCYLSTDRTGKFLLAAYYSAGLATVHAIAADGALQEEMVCRYPTETYAHYIATDPENRYAFVPHVESANSIYQFDFDAATGQLTPNKTTPILACGEGEGPRHLAFHPTLDTVYADNEQGSSVTVYRFEKDRGTLAPLQTVSTLPAGGCEGNSNAQIQIHPSGKSIYVSNRGHDSLAMFSIDPETGLITSLGQQPGEEVPRAFGIDPDGGYLYSGADGSHRLRTFSIGPDGVLAPHAEPIDLGGTAAWVYPLALL